MRSDQQLLNKYAHSEYSQHGEEGILEHIFEVLKVKKGWCAELGAWDGKRFSNTYYFITQKGWSGILIEANLDRFTELKENYKDRKDVYCFQKFVGFEKNDGLDSTFSETPMPKDMDLLSIDVDGNDYHLWDSVKIYNPKVVIIEYNPTIPNPIAFTQPRDMSINQGSSLLAIVNLAKSKGYELIAVTETNGIFVRKEFFTLFDISANSIEDLRLPNSFETHIFQLYDGTLVLSGNKKLLWSGVTINERKIQMLPKSLRFFQTNNPIKKLLRKACRWMLKRS